MELLNENYWNEFYLKDETRWDIGTVSPPLKAYFDQLDDKSIRILVPGCGNAHEAVYLMQEGFKDVTLIDLAEEPVIRVREKLSEFDGKEIEIVQGDFFDYEFSGKFDLIIEQTFFCAIDRNLRENYMQRVFDRLNVGGKLVGVLFKTEFEKEGPPFGGTVEEYKSLFGNKFQIHHLEDCYNSHPKREGNELFVSFIK